jgi:hypothetical protein
MAVFRHFMGHASVLVDFLRVERYIQENINFILFRIIGHDSGNRLTEGLFWKAALVGMMPTWRLFEFFKREAKYGARNAEGYPFK